MIDLEDYYIEVDEDGNDYLVIHQPNKQRKNKQE